MAISSTKSVSSVTDGASSTYTAQVTGTLATGTVAAFANVYTARLGTRQTSLAVTVSLSAAAEVTVACYDTVGYSATKTTSSTGTGTYSAGGSFSPAVTSYTPAASSLEISDVAGSSCGAPAVITGPSSPSGSSFFTGGLATGTSCLASPATTFQFVGAVSYFSSSAGAATTDGYTVTSPQSVGVNTANWAEAAASFPANAVNSQSLTDTVSLAVSNALAGTARVQTITLKVIAQTAQAALAETTGLLVNTQLAQRLNSEQDCLGVKVNLTKATYIVNTGAICGAPVTAGATLVLACNFFQFQCWAIPLMYLGMIDGFFIGVAGAFRVSEKSALYLIVAGLTWGSLVEISLGIMTPMLPIILIALNIAYSFRLDKAVAQLAAPQR